MISPSTISDQLQAILEMCSKIAKEIQEQSDNALNYNIAGAVIGAAVAAVLLSIFTAIATIVMANMLKEKAKLRLDKAFSEGIPPEQFLKKKLIKDKVMHWPLEVQKKIDQGLESNRNSTAFQTRIHYISGQSGVGKTSLIRHRAWSNDCTIINIDCEIFCKKDFFTQMANSPQDKAIALWEEIKNTIKKQKNKKVIFIFDEFDKAPPEYRAAFLSQTKSIGSDEVDEILKNAHIYLLGNDPFEEALTPVVVGNDKFGLGSIIQIVNSAQGASPQLQTAIDESAKLRGILARRVDHIEFNCFDDLDFLYMFLTRIAQNTSTNTKCQKLKELHEKHNAVIQSIKKGSGRASKAKSEKNKIEIQKDYYETLEGFLNKDSMKELSKVLMHSFQHTLCQALQKTYDDERGGDKIDKFSTALSNAFLSDKVVFAPLIVKMSCIALNIPQPGSVDWSKIGSGSGEGEMRTLIDNFLLHENSENRDLFLKMLKKLIPSIEVATLDENFFDSIKKLFWINYLSTDFTCRNVNQIDSVLNTMSKSILNGLDAAPEGLESESLIFETLKNELEAYDEQPEEIEKHLDDKVDGDAIRWAFLTRNHRKPFIGLDGANTAVGEDLSADGENLSSGEQGKAKHYSSKLPIPEAVKDQFAQYFNVDEQLRQLIQNTMAGPGSGMGAVPGSGMGAVPGSVMVAIPGSGMVAVPEQEMQKFVKDRMDRMKRGLTDHMQSSEPQLSQGPHFDPALMIDTSAGDQTLQDHDLGASNDTSAAGDQTLQDHGSVASKDDDSSPSSLVNVEEAAGAKKSGSIPSLD